MCSLERRKVGGIYLAMFGRCRRKLTLTAMRFLGNFLLARHCIAKDSISFLIGEDIAEVLLLY